LLFRPLLAPFDLLPREVFVFGLARFVSHFHSSGLGALCVSVVRKRISPQRHRAHRDHTKILSSFSSRSLSRISAAFSKSRFFAASFISFVRRLIALSMSSSPRSSLAFEEGPPGISK